MVRVSVILLLVGMAHGAEAGEPRPAEDYVIRVAEMDTDFALFEIFLPEAEKGRKDVVHEVVDPSGSVLATQKFGTATGHYKIAMVARYTSGTPYTLVIDGKYRLTFEHRTGAARSGS